MPLPAIIDTAREHLFDDRDALAKAELPAATIAHIIRLRDVYTYWLQFPTKKDREIVAELKRRGNIGDTQARTDLRLIKVLLGDLQKCTKDYHRYRFIEMITRTYNRASDAGDISSMVKAAAMYAKYTQLDKEDDRDARYDLIQPQKFVFTDDPRVIGIEPLPDFREKIRKKKDQYWTEQTEEVEFEEIDFDQDELFRPKNAPELPEL